MDARIKISLEFSISESGLEDALDEYDELSVEGLISEIVDKSVACDDIVAKVTEGLEVANVNIIDGGDGQAIAGYVGAYPSIVIEILDKIRQTVGIDVMKVLANQTQGGSQ